MKTLVSMIFAVGLASYLALLVGAVLSHFGGIK